MFVAILMQCCPHVVIPSGLKYLGLGALGWLSSNHSSGNGFGRVDPTPGEPIKMIREFEE